MRRVVAERAGWARRTLLRLRGTVEWRGRANGGGWKGERVVGGKGVVTQRGATWRNVQNQDDKRGVCPVMYGAQIRAIVPITVRIIGDELVRGSVESAPTFTVP